MDRYKVGMISLGCDKNRVDSEIILGNLNSKYQFTNSEKEADIIIINTCGFIESAKQESIDTILEMARYKEKGNCKLLIATGCLTQRYGSELQELIPEIDVMLGVNDYNKINELINNFIDNNIKTLAINYSDSNINEGSRVLTTAKHTAYIRIAEGCDNFCTYCIIPKIRGRFRSRYIESIVDEAKNLVNNGVKELILIAQDTTLYGKDIYNEKKLHILIKELSKINDLKWIRILYCYPEEIYDELITEIAENDKVVKYLDIPIQHISTHILKLMGRKTTKEEIINKINNIRNKIPEIIIRTTLITGFPGETEEDHNQAVNFLKEFKIDKVGVFTYSREEGTPAAEMKCQISEEIKISRQNELMSVQNQISGQINKLKIDKIYDTLVENYNGEYYFGRSYEMAPDIDGIIMFQSNNKISIGDYVKVRIISYTDYDLIGVVSDESSK